MSDPRATCPRCGASTEGPVRHELGGVACDYRHARRLAERPGWMLATTGDLAEAWGGEKEPTCSSETNERRLGLAAGWGWALGPWHGVPAPVLLAMAKAQTTKRRVASVLDVVRRLREDPAFRADVEAEVALGALAGAADPTSLARAERRNRPGRSTSTPAQRRS